MATELAKAYVQIIPSAEGIGGKLNGLLGGEAAAAGGYAGKSLGKTLVGTLIKVLAAAGIGKALQSAFASGSQFETAVAKVATIADTGSVSIGTLRGQITAMSAETSPKRPTRPSAPGRKPKTPWPLPGRPPSWRPPALPPAPRRWTSLPRP